MARKSRCQSSSPVPTRASDEITNDFMAKLEKVPGAVDVGLSEQEPKDELKIELNRGLAHSLGISADPTWRKPRAWLFAGVEVGDWGRPDRRSRDVAVRLNPEDRVKAENIEHLPIAVAGTGVLVPLDQIASITMGKGPSQIKHADGKTHDRGVIQCARPLAW